MGRFPLRTLGRAAGSPALGPALAMPMLAGLLALTGRSLAGPLQPRAEISKPAHTHVDIARHRSDVITVKFRDGLLIRLRDGMLTDMGTGNLAGAEAVLRSVVGGQWKKVHSLPEARLDLLRETAQNNLGKVVADFNLEFFLEPPSPSPRVQSGVDGMPQIGPGGLVHRTMLRMRAGGLPTDVGPVRANLIRVHGELADGTVLDETLYRLGIDFDAPTTLSYQVIDPTTNEPPPEREPPIDPDIPPDSDDDSVEDPPMDDSDEDSDEDSEDDVDEPGDRGGVVDCGSNRRRVGMVTVSWTTTRR